MNACPKSNRRRALTLIEVLVVVVIVAVLITLILAIVPRMRRAATVTRVQQQINILQGAIDQYFGDFRAYPGPLSDEQILLGHNPPGNIGANRPTGAENLVLGLLGGLRPAATGTSFSAQAVGKGALNLSAALPSPPRAYLEGSVLKDMLAENGEFRDVGGRRSDDSAIPEFVDQFESPLPILYLRARPGVRGIMSDSGVLIDAKPANYDLRSITAYTRSQIGLKTGSHGLRELGDSARIPSGIDRAGPNTALRYFRQPDLPAPGETSNILGTPRQKDRYILISAGVDRIYGTGDDITSFGGFAN